jgi:UDP-3-O-acyl N-acetylglucosamine deacetylase
MRDKTMAERRQKTLKRNAEICGFGLFSGVDVSLRFHPAPENTGVVFHRVDLKGQPDVPVSLAFLESTHRRTSLVNGNARVELTEHVLAALAGLQIDNCLIEIDAAEVPGVDGSCRPFVEELLAAGIVEQSALRSSLRIEQALEVESERGDASVQIRPHMSEGLVITYHLDYGHSSPIPPQTFTVNVTPETFLQEIAFARTFVLESEVATLKAAGYGQRVTEKDLLVYGEDGVIGNTLRAVDECVRHKILDAIGDFALLGCDLKGHITAWRSGHHLNQQLAQNIEAANRQQSVPPTSHVA